MKPEDRDKLRQDAPVPGRNHARPPGAPIPTLDPESPYPMSVPLVVVTNEATNEADRSITENLLQQCLQGDVYHCPRCTYTTANPEEMINHLADEINKASDRISQIYTEHGIRREIEPIP